MPTKNETLALTYGLGNMPTLHQTRNRTWSNTLNYTTRDGNQTSLPINSYDDSQTRLSQVPVRHWQKSCPNCTVYYTNTGYSGTSALLGRHGELSALSANLEKSDAACENEALVKALGKIADAKTNLAVTMAEARKTSDLILDRASRLYRAYRDFRRGAFGDAAHTLGIRAPKGRRGVTHQSWLEWQYGWMPLVMDVKNSAEFFAQQSLGGRRPEFSVSAKVETSGSYSKKTLDSAYSQGSFYVETSQSKKVYHVKIWCVIDNPHFNSMQQLGLTNPALVAWELVPFSFVFDWFCQVGDYLQGLTALHGVSVRRAMSSRLREVQTEYLSVAQPRLDAVTGAQWSGYTFKFSSLGRRYIRSPITVNPLSIYPPVSDDPFNFKRLASGLALIRGNARGLRV